MVTEFCAVGDISCRTFCTLPERNEAAAIVQNNASAKRDAKTL